MNVFFRFVIGLSLMVASLVVSAGSERVEWLFSGMVSSEKGNEYGYFFQVKKKANHYQALATIVDSETNKVVFRGDGQADIDHALPNEWHVGAGFLSFNPINDSWVFGFKSKGRQGFNFKVDTLHQSTQKPVFHALMPGVHLGINQASNLNGHIQLSEDASEQFVTAKKTWFRYLTQDKTELKVPPVSGVLCRFADGSGFYTVNLAEKNAANAALAGWYDAQGNLVDMSQFVQISQTPDALWHVNIPTPAHDITLPNASMQKDVIFGFAEGYTPKGFCMLNATIMR